MASDGSRRPLGRGVVVAAVLGAVMAVGAGVVVLRSRPVPVTPPVASDAEDALAQVVETALASEDLEAARETGMRLRAVGEPALLVVPRLREALAASSAGQRATAAVLLGRMGAAGADAVPELVVALADPDTTVRQECALALGYMGARAEPGVAHLVRLLVDPAQPVRLAAVSALGEIGPAAAAALPDLGRLASSDPDTLVRIFAAAAIKRIAPQAGPSPAADHIST